MKTENTDILISSETPLFNIQCAFAQLYPFLKIEFINIVGRVKPFKSIHMDEVRILREVATISGSVSISIQNTRTISELIHDFKTALSLAVSVYRKSGNVWNEISVTDGWTLDSQNKAGEFISTEMTTASLVG